MPFDQRVVETRGDIDDVFQENKQNILQKTAVSNMIGVLEQLNKISLFAAEIFTDILETTETNNKRIKTVRSRLQNIEQRVEPTEKMLLINAPSYFYDNPFTGKEWQRRDPLRGLLFRRDRANQSVNRRREIGLPAPDLSSMDGISSVPCIKKYSDSNFFMNEWLEAEKKKMEEEKAKRREKKKKRKKRKRQGADKITSIERWVYDPITGKKVKKKATEIAVKKYELTDSNAAANLDFESADRGVSKVAAMANRKEEAKIIKKQQKAAKKAQYSNLSPDAQHQAGLASYAQGIPEMSAIEATSSPKAAAPPPNPMMGGAPGGAGGGPPPNPVAAAPPPNPMMGGPGGPPPNPVSGGPGGAPPPNPMMGGGGGPGGPGGPPPVPVKKKLTGAEMAALSRQNAQESGAYHAPTVTQQPAAKPPPMVPVASSALLAGIRGGMKLKKATQVKRAPVMDSRDNLMAALRKKGQTGLKKVKQEDINVKKEEKVDNTIFAILNRRQYMADDSDSESGSSWSDDSD